MHLNIPLMLLVSTITESETDTITTVCHHGYKKQCLTLIVNIPSSKVWMAASGEKTSQQL